MQLTQNRGESLCDYMAKFNNKAIEVSNLICSSILVALLDDTRDDEFKKSFMLN